MKLQFTKKNGGFLKGDIVDLPVTPVIEGEGLLGDVYEPFRQLLAIIDALPDEAWKQNDQPLSRHIPGVWPTVGDLRALIAKHYEEKGVNNE
jgi:hypothetical protein